MNYQNPAQLRRRCAELEIKVENLTEERNRAESLVHAKNHKHAQQLVSRAKCRLEAFLYGFLGTVCGGGLFYGVLSWAEWAAEQCSRL